jgi:hypothetical protein
MQQIRIESLLLSLRRLFVLHTNRFPRGIMLVYLQISRSEEEIVATLIARI